MEVCSFQIQVFFSKNKNIMSNNLYDDQSKQKY